jgi:4-hydroxythreonine-4-phosphate dehydrogenase
MHKPVVAITMGDAAGIGPEIIVKTLQNQHLYESCTPFVIGDLGVMREVAGMIDESVQVAPVDSAGTVRGQFGQVEVLDLGGIDRSKLVMGKVDPMCGNAAVEYTIRAGQMALAKEIDAVVSAPLNKEAMRAAGYNYEGATEIFGTLAGSKLYGMLLLLNTFRLMLYTTHMSLIEACHAVKKDKLLQKIRLCHQGLTLFRLPRAHIAVSALNPHAGEGGLFGREEVDEIVPAIEAARKEGIDVVGPIPSDTVFVRAYKGEFDLVISLFHDQGNMAMKLLGFGNVVTLLVGIPFIRTSVGHGTAFDIAGKNVADPTNLTKAVAEAANLAQKFGAS